MIDGERQRTTTMQLSTPTSKYRGAYGASMDLEFGVAFRGTLAGEVPTIAGDADDALQDSDDRTHAANRRTVTSSAS
jgi:hypothetical protein